jgi:hypothetical protein
VTDLRVIPWIRDLDELRAVALARSLIHAELGRLGLPLSDASMSGRVKVRDQGVDGRTNFPVGSSGLFPIGRQVWQIKSGSSAPDASKEFDPKHIALIEAIRDGYNYVLFWTNDPVDPTASAVKDKFQEAVRAIRADASATFVFADAIEGMCYAHLAVLSLIPALPLRGVISLSTWGQRQDFEIPFQIDDQRRDHAETLRAHVRSKDSSSSALHLYGDTGVGKSRLAYEALAEEGVVERVLVALDPNDLDRSLLTLIAGSPERHLILVVDECTSEDRQSVAKYADLAQGRIRLITIGSRYSRDPQPTDARYLELLPLATAASREIALSVGLSEADADVVALYTEGYPKLAFVLADAISHSGRTANLLDRVQSEAVGSVLSSMLTNPDDVILLGGLALFEKLGFDGDLAPEAVIACETFGINEEKFREVVDRELNRFVSSAGRYRIVTPRLLAVWLASQFIQRNGGLADALQRLPETLRDRMIGQMKEFAGDQHVGKALRRLFEQFPFTTGALDDVDEGSARLLHVAAIIDPALAMDVIESMLADFPTESLRDSLRRGRRGLVNALEVLIWFDDTFERAATALLRLALAENETWSSNATGTIHGIFRIHLGGTAASYAQRLAWARSALAEDPETDYLLIPGIANAFAAHEMRHNPEFASRTAPPEWRPQERGEEIAARRGAWQILIELARAGRSIDIIATALADGLRTAARRGLAEDVLSDLPTVEWSPSARAQLSEAVSHLMKYDEPPSDMVGRFQELQTRLIGSTREDQVAFLVSQEPWQLYEEGRNDKLSPLLPQLAAQLAASGSPAILDAARNTRTGNRQTVGLLFEHIAREMPDGASQMALESEHPLPEAAVLGTLVGLTKSLGPEWGLEQLRRWLQDGPGRLVLQAIHMLPASAELAELAIQAVRDGHSDARELGRFLYGAWARDLPAEHLGTIMVLLADTAEATAIEQALGILSQWFDEHPDHQRVDLDRIALDLITVATENPGRRSSMVGLLRQKVLTRLRVPIDLQLQVVANMLSHLNSPLSEYDLQMIESLASRNPGQTIETVMTAIIGERGPDSVGSVLWLESSKILSRLAAVATSEAVLREIDKIPSGRWRELVAHVSFSQPEPGPLVETLVTKSTDDVVHARAAFGFMYPESGWIGRESDYLQARRSVAISWLGHTNSRIMQRWLRELIDELDARIAAAVLAEAEEDS